MKCEISGKLMGAEIIIVCIVIALSFFIISRQSRDDAYSDVKEFNKLNCEFTELDKNMCDGISIAGFNVTNFINKFQSNDLDIVVTMKGSTTSNSTQTIKKISNTCNIKPTAKFLVTILRDTNHEIVGIHFMQQ